MSTRSYHTVHYNTNDRTPRSPTIHKVYPPNGLRQIRRTSPPFGIPNNNALLARNSEFGRQHVYRIEVMRDPEG